MIKVGFTGTQKGMTAIQLLRVSELIEGAAELHHGDCIGADDEVDKVAAILGIPKVIHPPLENKKRSFCARGQFLILRTKDYLERNRDIVDATEYLVAAPSGAEQIRSGTWSTIRYARSLGKPISIVMPDGVLEETA